MRRSFFVLLFLGLTTSAIPSSAIIQGNFLSGPGFYWVVGLERYLSKGGVQCTGSLIAPDWVLTAAHCFDEEEVDTDADVHVLEFPEHFDFKRFRKSKDVQRHYRSQQVGKVLESGAVKRVIFSEVADLALVQLEGPLRVPKYFPQVVSPEGARELRAQNPESPVMVLGLGRNADLPHNRGVVLEGSYSGFVKKHYETQLLKPSLKTAGVHYPVLAEAGLYESHYITSNGPGSVGGSANVSMAAPGDSGGPMMTFVEGEWKIIGVNIAGQASLYARLVNWLTGRDVIFHVLQSVKVDLFLCDMLAQTEPGDLKLPGYESCSQ